MRVIHFAVTGLIKKAQELRKDLNLIDEVVIPGAENGLFSYDDNISIVAGELYKGKSVNNSFESVKLSKEEELTELAHLNEMVKGIDIDIPTTLSVYLEVINNKIYLIRSVNIKGL